MTMLDAATLWTTPTLISQYPEKGGESVHIQWAEIDNFSALTSGDNRAVETVKDLLHIARAPKQDIQLKTYYIKASGFNFENLPSTISGIELRLTTSRHSRITDDTVQLWSNDKLIGDNQATAAINPVKLYGGPTELWDIKRFKPELITSADFGVVIRLQAHPHWPHRDPAAISAIELRIY